MTNDETKAAIVALCNAMYEGQRNDVGTDLDYQGWTAWIDCVDDMQSYATEALALAGLHAKVRKLAEAAKQRIAIALARDDGADHAPMSHAEHRRVMEIRRERIRDNGGCELYEAITAVIAERADPWVPRQ